MKILYKPPRDEFITECEYCKCIFQFNKAEAVDKTEEFLGGIVDYWAVQCPNCHRGLSLTKELFSEKVYPKYLDRQRAKLVERGGVFDGTV